MAWFYVHESYEIWKKFWILSTLFVSELYPFLAECNCWSFQKFKKCKLLKFTVCYIFIPAIMMKLINSVTHCCSDESNSLCLVATNFLTRREYWFEEESFFFDTSILQQGQLSWWILEQTVFETKMAFKLLLQ